MAYIRNNKKHVSGKLLQRSNLSIKHAVDVIRRSQLSPYVSAVYLFGSCARNEQTYSSDVDMLLELDENIDKEKYHMEIIKVISSVTPLDDTLPEVDLKIEIGDMWKQDGTTFHKQILKEGKQLWNGSKTQQAI